MQEIQSRFPGEWTCKICDSGHNGYLSTQTWWRSAPPKVCWRCVARRLAEAPSTIFAIDLIAYAFCLAGWREKRGDDIRFVLSVNQLSVEGLSDRRLAACVARSLKDLTFED